MYRFIEKIRRAAAGYEPALVSAIVAAGFTLAAGLGLIVGSLPEQVDAVLTFVAFVAPILAGTYTRAKVSPLKTISVPPKFNQ